MLKINLSKKAIKFIKSLPLKQMKQIERKLADLSVSPLVSDTKRLKGYTDFHRVDSGEYRIVYQFDYEEKTLMILAIGKRNDGDIYKKLKRMF